jgi:hypothetical protein
MISQAFFLVTIITQPATGEMDAASNPGYTLTTCAFSPVAMTMAATGIIALFAFVVIIGLRELKQNGMPLVGSCSLAIAASCQVPPATSASLPLMWGDVSCPLGLPGFTDFDGEDDEAARHCSFANKDVTVPIAGKLYR